MAVTGKLQQKFWKLVIEIKISYDGFLSTITAVGHILPLPIGSFILVNEYH